MEMGKCVDYDGDHPAILRLWSASRMFTILEEFQEAGGVRYEVLLQTAFKCLVTDKRDMVFAFRELQIIIERCLDQTIHRLHQWTKFIERQPGSALLREVS